MKKSHQQQRGNARTRIPQRQQVEMQFLSLDQWLDKEHRVRDIWRYVESLDLSELYQGIKATVDNVGRDAIDPQVLFALWLFATLEGIGSARRISELTTRDIPYMWICGGQSVNYHRLSDFRSEHGNLLERILTESIAVLLHHELIDLDTIGQDGMRVRASAGSGSFRRQASLQEALELAETRVAEVQQPSGEEHDGGDKRRQAARQRAARQKQERIEAAILEMEDNGTKVYAPLYAEEQQLVKGEAPWAARPAESAGMTAHRKRMGTPAGKATYKRRSAIAEFPNAELPNADCRNRGLIQFRVRGLNKAKAQTLWHALVYNFLRMKNLICPRREQSYLEIVMES